MDFFAYSLWDVFNELVDGSFNFIIISDLFELGTTRVYHGQASFVGLLDRLSRLLLLILLLLFLNFDFNVFIIEDYIFFHKL